jgi:hypothetical protein
MPATARAQALTVSKSIAVEYGRRIVCNLLVRADAVQWWFGAISHSKGISIATASSS